MIKLLAIYLDAVKWSSKIRASCACISGTENLVRAGTDVDEASRNAEEKLLAEKAAIELKLSKISEYKSGLKKPR